MPTMHLTQRAIGKLVAPHPDGNDMWDTTYRIGCEFIRAELIRRAEERGELGASAENLRCPHIDGAASDAMRKRRSSEKE
jgi:hypothetical protein